MKRCLPLVALLLAAPVYAAQPDLPPIEVPLTTPDQMTGAAGAAPTGDLAFAAFQRGEYMTAMNEALKRVDKKDEPAPAMTLIGVIYENGLGFNKDAAKAVEWYTLGAENGDHNSMVALALLKLEGSGTPKDPKGAADLFEQAAAKGDPIAMYNVGLLELQGSVRPYDVKAATANFRKAADAGYADAQYALAMSLRQSNTPEDRKEATRLLGLATNQHHPDAAVEYAIAVFNGDGTEKDESRAAKLFLRAALKGNVIAMNRLARIYYSGRGFDEDRIRAAAWHLVARANGRSDSLLDEELTKLTTEERAQADRLAGQFRRQLSAALDASAADRQ